VVLGVTCRWSMLGAAIILTLLQLLSTKKVFKNLFAVFVVGHAFSLMWPYFLVNKQIMLAQVLLEVTSLAIALNILQLWLMTKSIEEEDKKEVESVEKMISMV
jgi:hypothetical protein